jgi:hypothetical protein
MFTFGRRNSKQKEVPFEMRAGPLDQNAIKHEEPATAGRTCPKNINAYDTDIRFKSELDGKQRTVKVHLTDKPFASGMQAKVIARNIAKYSGLKGNGQKCPPADFRFLSYLDRA